MQVMRPLAVVAPSPRFSAALPLLAASGSAASGTSPGQAPKKAIVLGEAKGAAPELERFVPRFLSTASDRGLGAIVDARLSGARLADVAVPGEAGAEFRKAWPADVYLGILLSPCVIQHREGRIHVRQEDPRTGTPVRVEDIVVSYGRRIAPSASRS